jgi:hypothetical protein
MKCEQFRKKLLEEPGNEDADFHAHRQVCPPCDKAYKEAMLFEKHLEAAFSHADGDDSDEKMPDAVLDHVSQYRKSRRRVFSIAASLLLLVMAGVASFHLYQIRSLNDFVLAHIDHEIEQLNNTQKVSFSRLERFVSQFDVPDLSVLPAITYVEKCWMRTGYGLHLILNGQKGPVTLLFMPNESVQQGQIIQARDFSGKLYRFGQGSFALVGRPGEPLEMLAEKLRMASASAATPTL